MISDLLNLAYKVPNFVTPTHSCLPSAHAPFILLYQSGCDRLRCINKQPPNLSIYKHKGSVTSQTVWPIGISNGRWGHTDAERARSPMSDSIGKNKRVSTSTFKEAGKHSLFPGDSLRQPQGVLPAFSLQRPLNLLVPLPGAPFPPCWGAAPGYSLD